MENLERQFAKEFEIKNLDDLWCVESKWQDQREEFFYHKQ